MKKLNYFLMLGLTATLAFTSCSQQRYASRSTVRINDQAKEQVKEEKKEVAAIAPKQMEIGKPEAKAPETPLAQKPESVTPRPKEVLKQLRSEETGRYLRQVLKDPKEIKALISTPDNESKQDFKNNTGLDTSNQWIRIMIIGLIILLIGILLPGEIGWIFYTVGGIIMVVGLIFLLLELL